MIQTQTPNQIRRTELWKKIAGYKFEGLETPLIADRLRSYFGSSDPTTQAFAAKVAKKHGWTRDFALRAIAEYKKFVYLGVTSPTEVTPPAAIDIVWHEHLHFTREYREFCANVLGRHFDHSPELVSAEEQTGVFNAQYNATLELYQREFNMEPPVDIWGKPKFDARKLRNTDYKPRKKELVEDSVELISDDVPLHLLFDSLFGTKGVPGNPTDFSIGDDGRSGGAGSSASWDPPSTPSPTYESSPSHVDSSPSVSACSTSSCGGGCGGD
ncbi:MAG: hypothetical protein V4690_01980 [Patescibacteria group bacterium]